MNTAKVANKGLEELALEMAKISEGYCPRKKSEIRKDYLELLDVLKEMHPDSFVILATEDGKGDKEGMERIASGVYASLPELAQLLGRMLGDNPTMAVLFHPEFVKAVFADFDENKEKEV